MKTSRIESVFKSSFIRLKDPLLKPLYENDKLFIVDKPYGINTHRFGDSVTQEGIKEIFEKSFDNELFVVHRLDVTTTGVLVFAKTKEAAKEYSNKFANRAVKKRYLFLTASRSNSSIYECSEPIDNQEAFTKFKRIKRTTKYELWEAWPQTGRTHQIRKHAQYIGLPILGDATYGGDSFSTICLHCERIEFSETDFFWTYPPRHFERLWILHKPQAVEIFIEIDRRLRLFKFLNKDFELQSIRLAHRKDKKYTLDKIGKCLVLSWYDALESLDKKLWSYLSYHLGLDLYVRFMQDMGRDSNLKSTFWISKLEKPLEIFEAKETQLCYLAKFDQGHAVGIFLDQRAQRFFIKEQSQNKKVLNLFSYTSLFSVASAQGRASETHSVDLSKAYLEWSKENFKLNALNLETNKFYNRESYEFLVMCEKNEIKYDVVICDPPSFSRAKDGKVFKIDKDFKKLILLCLKVLNKKGLLLFSTNFEKKSAEAFYLELKKTLSSNEFKIQTVAPALDYEMTSINPDLKSFVISKNNH